MNKFFVFAFLIIVILLNACSFSSSKREANDTSVSIADNKIELILKALEENDEEGIISIFSEKALDESEEFNHSIVLICKLFDVAIFKLNTPDFHVFHFNFKLFKVTYAI